MPFFPDMKKLCSHLVDIGNGVHWVQDGKLNSHSAIIQLALLVNEFIPDAIWIVIPEAKDGFYVVLKHVEWLPKFDA